MADKSKKFRSSKMDSLKLPIEDYADQILKEIKENNCLVVVGETGSGKTTRLPQFLYKAGYASNGVICVTQPRRIAAISVATRVSEEIQCHLGGTVGYQVRFDDSTSDKTLIKYMTDGCLLREFLDDEKLNNYSVIILDEAHERSLDTDILFGLVRNMFLEKTRSPEKQDKKTKPLKVIVMSATLNHEKFSEFLCSCPVFEIPGRCFPVKSVYLDHIGVKDLQTPNYLKRAIETVMKIHLEEAPGDILVFLTGQEEIEHACDKLFENAEKIDYRHDVHYDEVEAMLILPLYGSLTTDLQKRVFDPADPGIRKVVVATNIAATSLTIEGIRYVVDSGFVKQLSFNPRTRLDSLNVVLISRSEAIQRAGRAGRTAPGKCFRSFSKEVYETAMTEETVPEIQRTSLGHVILYLKSMRIHDVLGFQYIDPPEAGMILQALKQLYFFGALDSGGNVTSLGRQMTEFPLSPGLSKTLIHSASLGCADLILPVAAMLSVENVYATPSGKKNLSLATQTRWELAEQAGGTNDFATLLYIYQQCHSSSSPSGWCRDHYIHWRALKLAYNIHRQLYGILQRQLGKHALPRETNLKSRELLRKALCSGFFCNVARKGSSGKSFRTMDGHATQVYIHPSSTLFGCEDKLDWIIFHDIIWTSKIFVRTVCPIRYEWVRDLLPRLHEVDSYSLSGWAHGKLTAAIKDEDERKQTTIRDNSQQESDSSSEAAKVLKRSTADTIAAARQRFLERKRARDQQQGT